MTKEFEKLLEYLTFAVFGRKNETVSDISLDDICNVSMKQGVFPLVFGALSAEEKKFIDKKWQGLFFQAMIKNEQKMAALVPIFKKHFLKQEDACFRFTLVVANWVNAKDLHSSA